MDIELLKKEIKRTVQSQILTIDRSFDLENAIEIYFKVINYKLLIRTTDDLDGLKSEKINVLQKVLVDKNISEESISLMGLFNQRFEAFVKKINYVLIELGEINVEITNNPTSPKAFMAIMSSINKANPFYIDEEGNKTIKKSEAKKDKINNPVFYLEDGIQKYKKLYTSSFNVNEYTDPNDPNLNAKYNNTFYYHFLRAYLLRNKQSHSSPGIDMISSFNNLLSTLISELWIIDFLKDKLKSGLLQIHGEKMDFTEYIENEIARLKDQNLKFVPLSVRPYTSNSVKDLPPIADLSTVEHLRIRILGEGGSGKTTTLEHLVYQRCLNWKDKSSDKIPVLLFLSNMTDEESIKIAIAKKIYIEINLVDELIEQNKIILLLDGINEMVKDSVKKVRSKEIVNLIDENKDLEIILTDRYSFDSYQDDPFKIPTYGIEKLNENQVGKFVEKYCLQSGHSPDNILAVLRSKPNIKNLWTRPLLLSRAIEIIKIEHDLPEKEVEIIGKFIDLMLKREKDEKMDPLLNIRSFKLLLGFIANKIYNENQSNHPTSEFKFIKLINEGARELGMEKYNAQYTIRIGFELEILSRKDELLQFYHQVYFEYFVNHFIKYELA